MTNEMRSGTKLCLSLKTDADAEEAAAFIHTLGPQGVWLLEGYFNISDNTTMSDWTMYCNAMAVQCSRCTNPCWILSLFVSTEFIFLCLL